MTMPANGFPGPARCADAVQHLRVFGTAAVVWLMGAGGSSLAAEPLPGRAVCADTALVLAIDGSGSIDEADYILQMQGYASAFRGHEVQSALRMAGVVDVAVVLWGDGDMSAQVLPFQRIVDGTDAERLAMDIDGLAREVTGNTGLARGIEVALDLLAEPGVCALRKIVDVSGDGRQKHMRLRYPSPTLDDLRKRAKDMGVTINALAIETDDLALAEYFEDRVIVGERAFVVPIRSMWDFGDAIIEKLQRELMAVDERDSVPRGMAPVIFRRVDFAGGVGDCRSGAREIWLFQDEPKAATTDDFGCPIKSPLCVCVH